MTAETSNATDSGASQDQVQKEELLLEKLQLDNDEQRARIAQLQLKWWQKPIGLVAMILPLVPLMAAGAAAIADGWSANARKLAVAEQKEALAEKQLNELEKRRLEIDKSNLELDNRMLESQQVQLKQDQDLLQARVVELTATEKKLVDTLFERYSNVCSIGGKIVTADDYDAAQAEYAKFDAFEVLSIDPKISKTIKLVGDQLEQWKTSGQRPAELEYAVLDVSLACKKAFGKRKSEQFQRPIRELTIAIYEEAEEIVKTLEAARDYADARETVDRFWELYYGQLVLVESDGVAGAMVQSGEALKAWTAGPPDKAVLTRLSDTFRNEYQSLLATQQAADEQTDRIALIAK